MCRNIKTLFNFEPPATGEEVRNASLQFVRKLCGFTKPSRTNQEAFDKAVERIAAVAEDLLTTLTTNAAARSREVESAKARARSTQRFAAAPPGP